MICYLQFQFDTQEKYTSTYTSNFIKLSTTYMISFYIQETSYTKQNGKQIHNGEYQSK